MNFVTSVLKKYIQNEPQEAVDDAPKQPDQAAGYSSSDNKENGFAQKVQKSDTDKSDVGCGSNKRKETRRSVLKSFDPLYIESPEKFQTPSSSKSNQPSRQQVVIEYSDESESADTSHLAEVSDDETAFVDACTATDESSGFQPQNKNLQLEESLLKFYTPEKVYVLQKASDSDSASTSDVAECQSVLTNIETSTSSSDQPHIQKEAVCSTLLPIDITESEIVSAINKKLTSDCDIIPTRSRFTISESELENYNVIRQRFSDDNIEPVLSDSQENAADTVEANSLTSVREIRNISPERSIAALGNEIRNDESSLAEEHQHSENRILEVTESTEKGASSDDSGQSEITVIDKRSVVELNLGEKEENSFSHTSKEKTDFTVPETEPQSSTSKETETLDNSHSVEENATEDINKYTEEETSGGTNKFQPEPEQIEEERICEENLEVQSEKGEASSSEFIPEKQESELQLPKEKELEKESQPECESQLEDKHTENQESIEEPFNKTFEKSEKCLESDRGIDFTFEQNSQRDIGSSCEVEFEPCHISEQSQKPLKSDDEKECELIEEPVEPQKHLDLICEEKLGIDKRKLESTELDLTCKEVEGTTSEVESASSPGEQISEKKTEESDSNTSETQKYEGLSAKSDDNAYSHQDEEHHLDSGLDSIEESYTKSPKSQVGDSEDSEKGEGEDQEISPDIEDTCLPDEKLNHPDNDEVKIVSIDERKSKIAVDDTAQDEQPQLLDNSKIEEKLDKPAEPDTDRTVINLTDNQKSNIKSSAAIDPIIKSKMADLSEKLNEQQQENSDLKLQLNAIQQAKASLELEIRQKEEVIIKTQAEALKNEQTYKQEIKQLREKLKENSKLIEKDGSKELEDQLKEAKAREAKAVAELNQRTKDDLNYQKIMEEYENTIATRFADYQKLKEEHETATRHLANIELAFSDVHQKYERTKALLEGFKSNEEALNAALQASEKTCKQHEERYESLKAHAKGQIEKSNKEILMLRDKYEMDINKVKAIIKRLEIKCSSLEVSLQQKTEECAALSALCDEVTGKKV